VHKVSDLYVLSIENLLSLERFGKKSAENLFKSIEDSKKAPFNRVLYALGIRYVGETVARKLATHFKNIDNLMNAKLEELTEVGEIGERIAQSVISFFADQKNRNIIEELRKAGVQLSMDETLVEKLSDKLNGLNIIISGNFERFSREEIKKLIEAHGGKNVSSISSKTNYLVAGSNIGPSKLVNAQKLKIPIISENDFVKMIE
jgi:DNA ligase (NAD+)